MVTYTYNPVLRKARGSRTEGYPQLHKGQPRLWDPPTQQKTHHIETIKSTLYKLQKKLPIF